MSYNMENSNDIKLECVIYDGDKAINLNESNYTLKMKFVIPVGSNKKWWQFWKEDNSIIASNLIKRLKLSYNQKLDTEHDSEIYLAIFNIQHK